ncbi:MULTISPECIES: WXG100 family type VII secretion target [Mycobacteroides]|uniref:Type VII secretion protein EsxH n=1 Tax=Mycobacteroides immunogenum TaxID=83262 RepID=A0A179VE77_9MYCO|nr:MULTISPECIES: WXG100 family type VII secretion target [Mycobacteroides]OAT69313.1 type VII secretion protein EsxH [Mycobacteroides immunogenum]SKT85045.1 WXG100 family type VII secretion target [Mycobacteroides abscessus subsp. massiliense]SKU05624.1 WXG100 family type VII secretion target [Mycobacteroides abscessus subsp. massiliense]
MVQITNHFPQQLAHADSMDTMVGALNAQSADIESHAASMAAQWQGGTGMSYQQWQQQWNANQQQLISAYKAGTDTHRDNTTTMMGRDAAEGAKWGG